MSVEDSSTPEAITPGGRLRRLRISRDLPQHELAAKVGISQPAISQIEKDEWTPRRGLRRRIAAALGVSSLDIWPADFLASRARAS